MLFSTKREKILVMKTITIGNLCKWVHGLNFFEFHLIKISVDSLTQRTFPYMEQYTQANMGLSAYFSFIILLAPLLWIFFSFSFIHGAQSQLRVENIKSLEIKCLRLTSKEFTSDHINLEPLFTRNSATQINVPAFWSCDEWGPRRLSLVFICLHIPPSKDWLVHKTFPGTT